MMDHRDDFNVRRVDSVNNREREPLQMGSPAREVQPRIARGELADAIELIVKVREIRSAQSRRLIVVPADSGFHVPRRGRHENNGRTHNDRWTRS